MTIQTSAGTSSPPDPITKIDDTTAIHYIAVKADHTSCKLAVQFARSFSRDPSHVTCPACLRRLERNAYMAGRAPVPPTPAAADEHAPANPTSASDCARGAPAPESAAAEKAALLTAAPACAPLPQPEAQVLAPAEQGVETAAAGAGDEPAPAAADQPEEADELTRLLADVRAAYTGKKQIEKALEDADKWLKELDGRLDVYFTNDVKTLIGHGVRVTKVVKTTTKIDAARAVAESDMLRSMLAPFSEVSYDTKRAISANPVIGRLLQPYTVESKGKPEFRHTLEAPSDARK